MAKQEEEDTKDDAGDPDVDADDDACGGHLVGGFLLPAVTWWAQGCLWGQVAGCGSAGLKHLPDTQSLGLLIPTSTTKSTDLCLCLWDPSLNFQFFLPVIEYYVPDTGNNTVNPPHGSYKVVIIIPLL